MGKVILICGKICSGKTHYANKIKEKENAVILSTDEVTYDLIDNEQGKFYDEFCIKVNKYLKKKTVEFVKAGCNVILDWGFWSFDERKEISEYFKSNSISYEWHYIDITDEQWKRNIAERNKRIEECNDKTDFYVDEGLFQKIISKFEEPSKEEIDVWYQPNNNI